MRIVAAIAAFAAGFFQHQTLRRPAVNFGATLGHPRSRHRITSFPENFEPPAFGADGFFVFEGWAPGTRTRAAIGNSVRVPDGPLRGASRKRPLCPYRGSSPGSCVSRSENDTKPGRLSLSPARMSVSERMGAEQCRA
jgi:hypothetical protein